MDKKNKIGFIGAGIMGQGMVQNLLKAGNEVSIIANKNRRPIEALVALGAKEMVSLTDMVSCCNCFILCLPSSKIAISVCDELFPLLSQGTLIIDCTTNDLVSVEELGKNAKKANFGDKFGEILVPTEQIVELKSGTKKTTERKFFPGYVLIQMELEDDTWQLVKQTPRVSGFVGGTKEKPLPISEDDVDNIINRIEVGEDAPAPKTIYEPGEVIRVCDGPFNDFNGVVEDVDYERNSVRVAVQILGRSTPVQLNFMQIEKT